jgi:MSHA biogenesis protein MshK
VRDTEDRPPAQPPRAPAAPRPEPPPIPFDAALGTILFSPDRRLAIVNGRIVGIGDDVNGARIVDITPATVLLRDARGRLRILTLGQGTQAPAAR